MSDELNDETKNLITEAAGNVLLSETESMVGASAPDAVEGISSIQDAAGSATNYVKRFNEQMENLRQNIEELNSSNGNVDSIIKISNKIEESTKNMLQDVTEDVLRKAEMLQNGARVVYRGQGKGHKDFKGGGGVWKDNETGQVVDTGTFTSPSLINGASYGHPNEGRVLGKLYYNANNQYEVTNSYHNFFSAISNLDDSKEAEDFVNKIKHLEYTWDVVKASFTKYWEIINPDALFKDEIDAIRNGFSANPKEIGKILNFDFESILKDYFHSFDEVEKYNKLKGEFRYSNEDMVIPNNLSSKNSESAFNNASIYGESFKSMFGGITDYVAKTIFEKFQDVTSIKFNNIQDGSDSSLSNHAIDYYGGSVDLKKEQFDNIVLEVDELSKIKGENNQPLINMIEKYQKDGILDENIFKTLFNDENFDPLSIDSKFKDNFNYKLNDILSPKIMEIMKSDFQDYNGDIFDNENIEFLNPERLINAANTFFKILADRHKVLEDKYKKETDDFDDFSFDDFDFDDDFDFEENDIGISEGATQGNYFYRVLNTYKSAKDYMISRINALSEYEKNNKLLPNDISELVNKEFINNVRGKLNFSENEKGDSFIYPSELHDNRNVNYPSEEDISITEVKNGLVAGLKELELEFKLANEYFKNILNNPLSSNLSINAGGKQYNVKAENVNDLIITKDGRAYVTDDADNIIATKDLGGLGKQQAVRYEDGATIGVMSPDEVRSFIALSESITELTNLKETFKQMAEGLAHQKGNEYNKVSSKISDINVNIGSTNAAKEQLLTSVINRSQEDYLDRFIDSLEDNFEAQDQADKRLIEFLKPYLDNISTNQQKIDDSVLGSGDNLKFRSLRSQLSEFRELGTSVSNMGAGELGMTSSERLISEEYKENTTIIDNYISSLKKIEDTIKNLQNEMQLETVTEEYKAKLTSDIAGETEKYNKLIEEFSEELPKINSKISNAIYDNDMIEDSLGNGPRNKLRDAKYAWVRDKRQTQLLLRNGELSNYDATGSLKDAFAKTAFNKSVGFKQRQGIVGWAANLGYNASGVGLSLALGGFATALKKAGDATLEFAKQSVEAYGEIQSIKTNLGIVYGSQSQADSTFNQIAEYSVKSPFGVQTVSEYAVLLKQSGIYASDLMGTLKQIGDVAGGNQQKFANIANAFSQIEANGKATTRQLRQFATAGIPVYKELSKELGVNISQIRKMTEQGKISAAVIEKVFSNMTGPGGTFENAVNIGAKTIKARQQNLEDARQLASSAVGDYLVHYGGTGYGDSVYETVLSMKEGLWDVVKNTFETQNISKTVKNIEKQRDKAAQLQDIYNQMKAKGASPEELEYMGKFIEKSTGYYDVSSQRAAMSNYLDLLVKDVKDKIVIDDETYTNTILKQQTDIQNKQNKDFLDELKILLVAASTGDFILGSTSIVSHARKQRENLNDYKNAGDDYTTIERYKKAYQEAKNKMSPENWALAQEGRLEETISLGVDNLDKANTKNEKGLANFYNNYVSKYENTENGKEEKLKKDEEEWNAQLAQYDKFSKFVSDSGRLMDNVTVSLGDWIDMINSGILQSEGNVAFNKNDIAIDNDRALLGLTGEALDEEIERRTKDFEHVANGVNDLLKLNNLTDFQREGLENLKDQFFTNGIINKGTEVVVDNVIEAFNTLIDSLTDAFSSKADKNLAAALENVFNYTSKVGRAGSFESINTGKDTYPLWQRILNQSFGTSLELFKNKAITRGDQAVDLWNTQQQRAGISNIARQMLNTSSYKDVLNKLDFGNNKNYVIGNTSNNGVTQIDWKKTYKNFSDFAISMESATNVTQAYVDSLTSDTDSLKDFIAQAFTITEDPGNVYDSEYKQHLGELANNIKAVDANAYDMMFKYDDNGEIIGLRENAAEAARALLEEKERMLAFGDAVASAKTEIDNMNKQIQGLTLQSDINLGKYNTGKFNGLNREDKQTFLSFIDEELDKDQWKKLQKDSNLSRESLIDSYIKGESLGITGGVDKEAVEDAKKKYEDLEALAVKRYLEIQKTNKGEDEYKKWADQFGDDLEEWVKKDVRKDGRTAYTADLKEAEAEYNRLNDIFTNGADASETLYTAFDALLEKVKQLRKATNEAAYSEGWYKLTTNGIEEGKVALNRTKSNWTGMDIYGDNTVGQQEALNFMGLEAGTSYKDWFNTLFTKTDEGYKNQKSFKEYAKSLSDEDIKFGGDYLNLKGGAKDLLEQYMNSEDKGSFLDSVFEGNADGKEDFLDFLTETVSRVDTLKNAFADMGKTIKDSFSSSLINGFTSSFQTMGKSLIKNTKDAKEAGEEYGKIWKNVAAEMFNAIGPAMAQAGLSMITKGHITSGLALLAASGVASFLGGLLSDDNDDDKSKQQEERLKNLKDLLLEVIEQAKTDAEYYEKNLRHENALSESNQISVNDAIISPNGNVISTAPDDYLIATKTPGSLVGGGQTKVNFTINNNSSNVQVKQEQKENADGSIDIIATIIDVVSNAVANGDMDEAFAARDYRANGQSYAY